MFLERWGGSWDEIMSVEERSLLEIRLLLFTNVEISKELFV